MGLILLGGGFAGSTVGIWVFKLLRELGQIELTISLCYVVLLGSLGTLMLVDALKIYARRHKSGGKLPTRDAHHHTWIHNLPYKIDSEEHTSELQSLMRISYAVFCLKNKTNTISKSTKQLTHTTNTTHVKRQCTT